MDKIPKKLIILIVLFALSGLVSWSLYFKEYVQKDTVNIHLFPKQIGEWKSEEMEITEREYNILETRNAFVRKYFTDDGKKLYIFIVYSQNNRKVSHPPELCFSGSGNMVLDKKKIQINVGGAGLDVIRLLMAQGTTKNIAYYWFKVGDSFTSNYWKQQGLIAIKSLLGKPSSSALIRISSIAEDGNIDASEQSLTEFTRQIMPLLKKYLP